MVNVQFPGLPTASVVEQVTVVTPLLKVVPEAGLQVGVFTPGQLSVAVAAGYDTTAVQTFASVVCTAARCDEPDDGDQLAPPSVLVSVNTSKKLSILNPPPPRLVIFV